MSKHALGIGGGSVRAPSQGCLSGVAFLRIGSAGIKVGIGNVIIYYQLTARTVIGGGVYCGIFSNSSVYGSLELSVSCIQPPVCI